MDRSVPWGVSPAIKVFVLLGITGWVGEKARENGGFITRVFGFEAALGFV
jgi:hypothetical protein